MHDLFDRLDPKDGFHVVLSETAGLTSLYCVCYAGGEINNPFGGSSDGSVLLTEVASPNEEQNGSLIRLHLVLEAVARYLRTGGTWEALEHGMTGIRTLAPGGIVFPGYHLVESYVTTEMLYQHVFRKIDTDEAVVWEEPAYTHSGGLAGGFIDRTTMTALREAQENDGWKSEEGKGQAGDSESPRAVGYLQDS